MQSDLGDIMENMEIESQADKEEEALDKEEVQVASLQDMAGEALVVRLTNSIFAQAIRDGASDIHISPQQNTVRCVFALTAN